MNQIIDRKKQDRDLQGTIEKGVCTKSVFVRKPETAALSLHITSQVASFVTQNAYSLKLWFSVYFLS